MTATIAPGSLREKVAVVTGASRGIGYAIASAFAREGARVIAGGRSESALRALVAASGGRIVAQRCDVTRGADVEALVARAEKEYGAVHVMCNNAGVIRSELLVETDEATWDLIMATNLKGVFLGCKYAIPAIARAGGGAIVNIGSVNCFIGEKMNAAYSASKGAVLLLTKCAAAECAANRVRVNVLCPGATDTEMSGAYFDAIGGREKGERWMRRHQPLAGMIRPDDVARAAVFLASDDSQSMTGTSLIVDGGLTASWDHVDP